MKKFGDVAHFYLGTGLEVQFSFGHETMTQEIDAVFRNGLLIFHGDNGRYQRNIERSCDDVKPILYPLSCLTEEITAEGYNNEKPFVPIKVIDWSGQIIINDDCSMLRFETVNQLIKWHFNVFNIPETEYINKQTLTN